VYITVRPTRKHKGRNIRGSDIVWYLCKDKWPEKELDHRDRNTLNDNIGNLKEVTSKQNTANRSVSNKAKIVVVSHRNKCVIRTVIKGIKVHICMCDIGEGHDIVRYLVEYLNGKKLGVEFYK
jgi:hypothetical protein